jgi:hypothetical protein
MLQYSCVPFTTSLTTERTTWAAVPPSGAVAGFTNVRPGGGSHIGGEWAMAPADQMCQCGVLFASIATSAMSIDAPQQLFRSRWWIRHRWRSRRLARRDGSGVEPLAVRHVTVAHLGGLFETESAARSAVRLRADPQVSGEADPSAWPFTKPIGCRGWRVGAGQRGGHIRPVPHLLGYEPGPEFMRLIPRPRAADASDFCPWARCCCARSAPSTGHRWRCPKWLVHGAPVTVQFVPAPTKQSP